MYTATYDQALNKASDMAPTLDRPTEFLRWAEDIVELIAFIYIQDYDTVTEDLMKVIKEEQGYDEDDEGKDN